MVEVLGVSGLIVHFFYIFIVYLKFESRQGKPFHCVIDSKKERCNFLHLVFCCESWVLFALECGLGLNMALYSGDHSQSYSKKL